MELILDADEVVKFEGKVKVVIGPGGAVTIELAPGESLDFEVERPEPREE